MHLYQHGHAELVGVRLELDHFGDAHGQILDGLCGPPIGSHAEDVRPLDLEQISEAVEQLGNLCVVNGHGAALSQSIDGKRARLKCSCIDNHQCTRPLRSPTSIMRCDQASTNNQ